MASASKTKPGMLRLFGQFKEREINGSRPIRTVDEGNYVLMVANDYKVVAQETIQDITSGSIKAAVYLSGLVALGVLHKSNPTQRDLETVLMECSQDLSLVNKSVRSERADGFIDKLSSAQRDGRLHHSSLGVLSLVWISEHKTGLGLYNANCKHINLPWYQWHKKVVDVGILGKFMALTEVMKDYDVNDNEWNNVES